MEKTIRKFIMGMKTSVVQSFIGVRVFMFISYDLIWILLLTSHKIIFTSCY